MLLDRCQVEVLGLVPIPSPGNPQEFYLYCPSTQSYLGCPNQSRQIHHYPRGTAWTLWRPCTKDSEHAGGYEYITDRVAFDRANLELVISRYNEDIAWTQAYEDILTVYEKHEDPRQHVVYDKQTSTAQQRILPNVGREGHTYLWHIGVQQRQQATPGGGLAKKIVFCKGSAASGSLPLGQFKSVQDFICYALDDHRRQIYVPRCSPTDDANPFPLMVGAQNQIQHVGKWRLRVPRAKKVKDFVEWMWPICAPVEPEFFKTVCYWIPNGVFAVESSMILNRPLEFYQRLQELVGHDSDPEEGHYLERSWIQMFSRYLPMEVVLFCQNTVTDRAQTACTQILDVLRHYPGARLHVVNACADLRRRQELHQFVMRGIVLKLSKTPMTYRLIQGPGFAQPITVWKAQILAELAEATDRDPNTVVVCLQEGETLDPREAFWLNYVFNTYKRAVVYRPAQVDKCHSRVAVQVKDLALLEPEKTLKTATDWDSQDRLVALTAQNLPGFEVVSSPSFLSLTASNQLWQQSKK